MKRRRSSGKSAPSYLLHRATGQARVLIHGKSYYLGTYNSQESHEKYRRLINEVWVGGSPKDGPVVDHPNSDSFTIAELAVSYAKVAKTYYVKNSKNGDIPIRC